MQFRIEQGRLPRIKVGTFRNDSDEHIDTGIIVNTMKVAIVNNGQAVFVADDSTQTQLREEKLDQLGNVNEDTAASIGNETGADFLLTGSVKTMVDRAGNVAERVYFVTAELTHLETGIIYWTEQNDEIKKVIQTPRVKF
jgi:PBP1b-binding outer membrane lipoprotein LpoB